MSKLVLVDSDALRKVAGLIQAAKPLLEREAKGDSRGIEFALTALFIVLTLEQARRLRQALPFVIALATGVAALLLLPDRHLLLGAIAAASLVLLVHYRFQAPARSGESHS